MMEKLTLYLYFCVFVVGVFGSQLNLTDSASEVCEHCSNVTSDINIEQEIMRFLDSALETDSYQILKGITLHKVRNSSAIKEEGNERSRESSGEKILNGLQRFAESRALEVKVPELLEGARLFSKQLRPRFAFGKNSFLTGFGLGFLAFGLKKLLLPLFIGAQIVKSILIAMFLPSILGGIGKLVGKGVTSFASSSGSSGAGAAADTTTDFDFKDNISYDNEPAGSDNYGVWSYPPNMLQNAIGRQPFPAYTSSGIAAMPAPMALVSDRYQQKLQITEPIGNANHQGSFYSREKQQDFKIFHNMPSSSQLLTNYDPFYSPLLSRLDSIFKQLGYTTESCRERLVCHMYSNPAKFAPYSNLVSAQLSRELNELRKPSSDNPEILRFFRYMKAAKDGQDGNTCDLTYAGCTVKGMTNDNPPMVTTFNDINKLVLARKLK